MAIESESEAITPTPRKAQAGVLLVHGLIARAERPARQRTLAAPSLVGGRRTGGAPIVLVQCESFFDARRVSPLIGSGLLPAFEACSTDAAFRGHLEVPGWGANTMRTEFAVLTGIPETELGYDRFNPYYALARAPLASQVWRLRQAGYRTICLHPFDRRFFRRKYDTEKTLAAFGTRLRTETDLAALCEHVVSMVQETMQPAQVSLWLAPMQHAPNQLMADSPLRLEARRQES